MVEEGVSELPPSSFEISLPAATEIVTESEPRLRLTYFKNSRIQPAHIENSLKALSGALEFVIPQTGNQQISVNSAVLSAQEFGDVTSQKQILTNRRNIGHPSSNARRLKIHDVHPVLDVYYNMLGGPT